MNYTKIRIVLKDATELYISEDELTVFKLSGDYHRIDYLNDKDQWNRLDGPAIEWANGDKSWYVDGQKHRLDGPAVDWVGRSKRWYANGQLHRLDGPAYEGPDGPAEWWIRGRNYTQEAFEKEIQ